MSAYAGPEIVNNGLVLSLDAGNARSYPGSGTTWTDLASGLTGTLTNGPTYSSSNGGSIVFDGVNDYTVLSSSTNWNLSGDFALESWFFPSSFGSFNAIMTSAVSNGLWFGRMTSGIGLRAYGVADVIATATLPSTGAWHHMVVTRNGSTISLYIDNAFVTSVVDTRTFPNSSLYIGTDDNLLGAPWNGRISVAKIHNGRALSAAEIRQNFNATRGRYGI